MKALPIFLLAVALAVSSSAQTSTNSAPDTSTKKVAAPIATLQVSAATVSKPFVVTNDAVSQPDETDMKSAGKAVFSFSVTNAGNYIIRAMVNAPEESANSFYVNVDAQPEDPMGIWDMEVTEGFQERTVSWRGNNGSPESDEFSPKVFKLSAGDHKLIIVGREPGTLLKSVSIYAAEQK